jgi:hypothetical protein
MNIESLDKILIEPDGSRKAILNPHLLDQQAREDLITVTLEAEGGIAVQWAPIYGIGSEISLNEIMTYNSVGEIRRKDFITGAAMALEDAAAIVVFQTTGKNIPLKNFKN